ncbi:unnamed protein product [Tetraodon nigroviridis]|uniref:Chromosome 8 SCAF14543, whole genome shotgun sequence n=1 Tax=Tetraodon nigroviridis TaxID=99883 RepID=Q4SNI0_TETNG|nr:unnamed protein product [Tetraodon nigroviridis]
MAAVHRRGYPLRHSVFWDETECLNYYGMLSLHEVFEIVGSQLTETDIEVLSFLLKEAFHSQDSLVDSSKPTSGLELLLELERRGYISDGNLEPLLQLLRVLTRHDLLPFVSRKKRRTVSPERIEHSYGLKNIALLCTSGMRHSRRHVEIPFSSFTQNLRTSIYPPVPDESPGRRRTRRKKRGNGWSRKPKKTSRQDQLMPPPLPPHKVSCSWIVTQIR